jgi:rod shape-determining protein MreC
MYFIRKYKERMIVALVAIILIVIIGYTGRERLKISETENLVGKILMPISDFSAGIHEKIGNVFSSIGDIFDAKEKNELLEARLLQLESENRDLKNVIGKEDYLKKEQMISQTTNYKLLKAEVIAKEPGNWFDQFIINKGEEDGILKGATVVQGIELERDVYIESLVGRVVDVGDNWSKVISVIDELNSTSFKIIRTQDGGIITGNIDSSLEGYLFDYTADIIEGDELYTSGLGGVYLKDIYIGEVIEIISDEEELTKRLVVKPSINFKKLYNVFVIIE